VQKLALSLLLMLAVGGASGACSPDYGCSPSATLVTPFVATVKVQPVVLTTPALAVQPVVASPVVVRERVVTPVLVRRRVLLVEHR